MTVSPCCTVICWWVPAAILVRTEVGSPCEPVQMMTVFAAGWFRISFTDMRMFAGTFR
jgi:hypothetical protein